MKIFTFIAVSFFISCAFINMKSNNNTKKIKLVNEDTVQARMNNFSYYFNKR